MRATLLSLLVLCFTGPALADERPNVLLFVIDDLGRTDFGFDGSAFHETPELDKLAKSAVRFTDFYSNHPVCSPTRAALMTGKAPQRLGITDWIHPNSGIAIPAAETTLGEAFHSHGYQTAYFGKWHLGEADADQPTKHGFEFIRGVNRAGQPGSYRFPYRQKADQTSVWDVPDFDNGKPGDYLTDVLTTSAIDFLKSRDTKRPFLLCFGHYAVHMPLQPPGGLPKKYQEKRTKLFGATPTPTVAAPFAAVSRGRQDHADYAAMVENLDTNIGRILRTLDDLGLRQQTIVVFTSDNGGLCTLAKGPGPTSNLPFRGGKGWNYEGGIRVSTLIAWNGHLSPATTSVPAWTADLYPTLLDLCGLPLAPQQHLDGRSLTGPLRGVADNALVERPLVWYYPHDHGSGHKASAAIRRGPWKLIHYLASGQSELYHLTDDVGESTNLAAKEPERTARLRKELLAWIEATKKSEPNEAGRK